MTQRRCLLMSTFNMDLRPWSGVLWEFFDVIARIESAEVVAPRNRFLDEHGHYAPVSQRIRFEAKLQRAFHRHVPQMEAASIRESYDLALYACHFIHEIDELARIKGWRRSASKAAIFLLEGWPSTFATRARSLAKLDLFDHVFVLNGSSIPDLARYTSTPISQLSTATDMVRTTPAPGHPDRVVDFCCIGRNSPAIHEQLLKLSDQKGMFYHYDVWRNQNVGLGWDAVRRWNADLIKRSRYVLVWDPAHPDARRVEADGAQVLSTRYFEGAAGGAVLLGSAPDCSEYHAAFDWPDALVPVEGDALRVIAELERDSVRVARIRADNIRHSLLRHDWVHRWREVLATFGLSPTRQHVAREDKLAVLAGKISDNAARLGHAS